MENKSYQAPAELPQEEKNDWEHIVKYILCGVCAELKSGR